MSELYTYNSTHLTTVREGTELTQSADHGAVGYGTFVIDDSGGTLAIVGQKTFRYTESACANTLTFDGFIASRGYSRNATERAPATTTARGIRVNVFDTNDRLNHLLITDGGKRPQETVQERLEWLLASDYVSFSDLGRVDYPNDDMDKADYRYQYAGDVLSDCALAAGSGWNYHVNDYGSGPELTFRNDNSSTDDSSTLRISNVLSDVDSDHTTLGATKTFGPSTDAELIRDPANVHSKHAKSYAKGTAVEELASTATTFNGERGGTSSNSNIKRLAQAERAATRELHTHSTEEDVITVTIQVPASAVNLMYQGWRIQCKFSHLTTEGYGSFTWMRCLERTVKPVGADAFSYLLTLKLVPQEAAEPEAACADDATPSGTYWPLGGDTPTSTANPSDGTVNYLRGGDYFPPVPTPGNIGHWHFPLFSAGGAATTDWAGDCSGNLLQFTLVGNGTAVISTEMYGGSPRTLNVWAGDGIDNTLVATISSGATVEVEITDATEGDCYRIIQVTDDASVCGGKWGFSGMVWTAA